ncbi:MAG: ribbon-helix-helix protein, CopG family [Phycisphaeraceae bacterium]
MNEPKETISARVNVELVSRIEALAATQERSRSEMVERCLARGIEAEEDRVKLAEGPISGAVLDLLTSSKYVVKFLEWVDGEKIDPAELARSKGMIARAKKARGAKSSKGKVTQ